MRQIRDEGLPEHFSAAHQLRQRHKAVKDFIGDVGCEKTDGTLVNIAFLKPAAIMRHAARHCAHLGALLARALRESDGRPLNLILYFDEVEPADPLKKSDRKVMCAYFSFA